MDVSTGVQIVLYFILLALLSPWLAKFLFHLFSGQTHFLSHPLRWLERMIYRAAGVSAEREMTVREYGWCLGLLNLFGLFLLLFLQLVQGHLPFNPAHRTSVPWRLEIGRASCRERV